MYTMFEPITVSGWQIAVLSVIWVLVAGLIARIEYGRKIEQERRKAEASGLDRERLIVSAISPRIAHQHIWPSEPAIVDGDMVVYVCTCGKRLIRRKRKGLLL